MDFPCLEILMCTKEKTTKNTARNLTEPQERDELDGSDGSDVLRKEILYTLRMLFLNRNRKKFDPIVVSRDPFDYEHFNNLITV